MNKNALRGFAVSGLLVMGLTACGGAGTSTDAASAPASETATPTPTPAKQHTLEELTAVLGQIKDKQGAKLSVMSSADMSGTLEQSKAMMSQIDVQPAACKDMALGSLAQPVDGVKAAFGVSQDVVTSSMSTISLGTGLGERIRDRAQESIDQLSACGTMTMGGPTGVSTITVTDLADKKPANALMAYRMDTKLPSGETGSALMSQAIKQDVLISVTVAGGASEADALANTTVLLDQAIELIK
ncbi:hypothetical protein [Paenarthrobacter aurescens]|jgi:hypothetical protein|uniref:Lipoprotein n=1 Tax=Paenarthrobacter aurescens (strain TC1) TaxID=290340 RepID=A1R503_PAEAT|nr:hypothetical protein [Paenarthrobacter aurescens]ABM06277.1 putative lipoprotein [Paenarthrobacter aurescens TC1]